MKKFVCKVCGHVCEEEENPPQHCPICFVGNEMLEEEKQD